MFHNVRRRTIVRLQLFGWFALTYSTIGLIWEYLETGRSTLEGASVGLVVAITLTAVEESRLGSFTRTMSVGKAILAKSLVYMVVLAVLVLIVGSVGGLMQGATRQDFADWIFSAEFPIKLAIIYLIHVIVVFARRINQLLGPRTLLRYISGKYHRPRVERRIFLFLDLKSSTMLAETLGAMKYFSFLNTVFRDISEPILERGAEIYQYIGDEVVLTWPVEQGLHNANCIRVFIEILAELDRRLEYYQNRFGYVPEFKAGLHFGDVIAAEIGDLKKEIVYNGDVLNTTARIQSMCNQFGQRLIASEELVSLLDLPEFVQPNPLGDVELRGKAEPIRLVALAQMNRSANPA
jgi:adenylate cyclase